MAQPSNEEYMLDQGIESALNRCVEKVLLERPANALDRLSDLLGGEEVRVLHVGTGHGSVRGCRRARISKSGRRRRRHAHCCPPPPNQELTRAHPRRDRHAGARALAMWPCVSRRLR